MYTSITLAPHVDSAWVPTPAFTLQLGEYLGVDQAQIFSMDSAPQYWEVDDDPDTELAFKSNISLREALDEWQRVNPLIMHIAFPVGPWAKRLVARLTHTMPPDVAQGYVAGDVSFMVGPWSYCDYDELRTVAEGTVHISLSGDGCPTDLSGYKRVFLATPEISELRTWLQDKSRHEWTACIILS